MSEYTEYYVIHAPSLDALKEKLEAHNIRAILDMEEVPGASGCGVHLRRSEYEALPTARRWAPVLTDATLARLGELFPRVLRLAVHENKYWWRIDCSLHKKVVRFLFSDMVWSGYDLEDGDEDLLLASLSPTTEQLGLLEELFSVPRAELLPYLSMDGVNMDGLEGFVKVTGIPLHILSNQVMIEVDELIPEGRTVIFLDEILD
jgi:hypothetical protein